MSIRNINLYRTLSVTIVMVFCMTGIYGIPGVAQEHSEEGRNWELMLGGGSYYMPEYTGSDKMQFEPVPLVIGFYETDRFKHFVEGDRVGTSLKFSSYIPWSLSAGVGFGAGRDHGELDILEGTPTLENHIRLFSELAVDLPIATLSTTVSYFPISANYEEVERSDKDYDGILADVKVSRQWMRIPFIVQVGGGFSRMNNEYAQAHYGVAYPSAHLEAFKARSGMHSLNLSANIMMFFHEHIGIMLLTEGKHLLSNAADSPLTKQTFQGEFGLMGFYRF